MDPSQLVSTPATDGMTELNQGASINVVTVDGGGTDATMGGQGIQPAAASAASAAPPGISVSGSATDKSALHGSGAGNVHEASDASSRAAAAPQQESGEKPAKRATKHPPLLTTSFLSPAKASTSPSSPPASGGPGFLQVQAASGTSMDSQQASDHITTLVNQHSLTCNWGLSVDQVLNDHKDKFMRYKRFINENAAHTNKNFTEMSENMKELATKVVPELGAMVQHQAEQLTAMESGVQAVTLQLDTSIHQRLSTLETNLQEYTSRLEGAIGKYTTELEAKLQALEASLSSPAASTSSDPQLRATVTTSHRLALEAKEATRQQATDFAKQLDALRGQLDTKFDEHMKDVTVAFEDSAIALQMVTNENEAKAITIQDRLDALHAQARTSQAIVEQHHARLAQYDTVISSTPVSSTPISPPAAFVPGESRMPAGNDSSSAEPAGATSVAEPPMADPWSKFSGSDPWHTAHSGPRTANTSQQPRAAATAPWDVPALAAPCPSPTPTSAITTMTKLFEVKDIATLTKNNGKGDLEGVDGAVELQTEWSLSGVVACVVVVVSVPLLLLHDARRMAFRSR